MRVLFIAQTYPYPLDTGTKRTIYHWLEAVRECHDVALLILATWHFPLVEIPGLANGTVRILPLVPGSRASQRISRFFVSLVRGIPATSLIGLTRAAKEEVRRMVETGPYDLAVLSENTVAGYAPLLVPVMPVVLLKHSVGGTDARDDRNRFGKLHPGWAAKEWIVKRFEGRTCRSATLVCAVNEEDARELSRRYRLSKPVQVVPIGVDPNDFPQRDSDPSGNVIGFFGNLTWGANVDAVRWFVEQVLPRVWEEEPTAQFRVIGPCEEGLRLTYRDPRIVFRGQVPQIAPELRDVTVGVVPVISGTGMRFKLLEMLAMGIPIVTTSLGKLGAGCVHGEHVLVGDDPESFAQGVTVLLRDAALRQKLIQGGARLAPAHAWEAIYKRIRSLLGMAVVEYKTYSSTQRS